MQENDHLKEQPILQDYDAWHHQLKNDAEHESPLIHP